MHLLRVAGYKCLAEETVERDMREGERGREGGREREDPDYEKKLKADWCCLVF